MTNPFEVINARLSNIESLLIDIKHLPTEKPSLNPSEVSDPWLALNELCAYLPGRPAKATVYAYVSAGTIPFHKRRKRLYFKKSEIDAWLNQGNKVSISKPLMPAVEEAHYG